MTHKLIYPALLEFSGDQIGVTFPDLPGCVSVGEDLASALENAREALLFHLEGMLEDGDAFPAATDYKTLKAGENEQVAIIDVVSPEKQERINISLSASDLARIDDQAKSAGQTRSVFMVQRSLDGVFYGTKNEEHEKPVRSYKKKAAAKRPAVKQKLSFPKRPRRASRNSASGKK